MATFINLSNHPSEGWNDAQKAAAKALVGGGVVIDLAFPQVDPCGDEGYIDNLAEDYLGTIIRTKDVECVHVMGEMNFTFAIVNKLKANGIKVVASTTVRDVVMDGDNKIVKFNFARFREY